MQFFNVEKPIAFFYVTRELKLFLFGNKHFIGFAGYIWKLNVMFMRLRRHLRASGGVFTPGH